MSPCRPVLTRPVRARPARGLVCGAGIECPWPGEHSRLGGDLYRAIYHVLLRRLPPEAAHRWAFRLIQLTASVPGLAWGLRRVLGPREPSLRTRALGLDFPGLHP